MTFEVGSVITVREVLHGEVWLEFPETVVTDDGTMLVTVQVDGSPMTQHPEHPFGPHPWSHLDAWSGTTVLKLRRDGDWYSVWRFFEGDRSLDWYVNFEQPVTRRQDGIDINDLQLDIVIDPDGAWHWKDVEDLGPAVASGRIDLGQLRAVLDAAPDLVRRLDEDDRWWASWDGWSPVES